MNKTEISTLLANKVNPETIALAMIAGTISRAYNNARYKVEDAASLDNNVNWRELFRFFEAVKDQDHHKATRSPDQHPKAEY